MLAAVLLLAGCATERASRVAEAIPQAGYVRLDVPFHPQTEYQCGPAALATVLGASGVAITPDALAPQVYLPGREGSLQVELLAASRRAGRIPYVVDETPQAISAEVQAGRPVLVLQNLLVRSLPKWHYAVVTGIDGVHQRVILNSGEQRDVQARAKGFLRSWDWGGRWGMVTLRPGELPANADVARYITAVADFEHVAGAAAAVPAYRAALERWPRDPRPHLALGNQAHAAGQRVEAVRHYRAGLALAPRDPVLGNNLASVLGELGCAAEARTALASARDGLDAGSPWRKALDETARELSANTTPRSRACNSLH